MHSVDSHSKFVFCPPQLGKPDPKEPRPLKGADTRPRVTQLGSKDNTCWYSVFNMLRDRLNAPNTKHLSERTFERFASERRKAVSAHERSLPDVADQLNATIIKKQYSEITPKNIDHFKFLLDYLDRFDPNTKVKLSTIIPKFKKQDKNLYEFLVYLKMNQRMKINELFFKKLGLNPKNLFNSIKKLDPDIYEGTFGLDWDLVPLNMKPTLLDHLARHVSTRRYGLEVSSWHPKQSIEKLMTELELHGPLAVGGIFGIPQYQAAPRDLKQQIQGRDIHGWMKDDPKNEVHLTGHMVLVVGAEKTERGEYVYFIDPMDESDPANPTKQRIFKMTYKRLTSDEAVCDLHGFLRTDAPALIGYALHRGRAEEENEFQIPLFDVQKSYISDQPKRARKILET